MRVLSSLTILLVGSLFVAGCETYDYRPLVVEAEADCAAETRQRQDWRYWALGLTPPQINWSDCEKPEAALAGADLHGAILRGVDLRNADLQQADLRAADLSDAHMPGANLKDAATLGIYLRGANLSGADLSGTALTGSDLTGVELTGATWTDGETVCAEGSVGACL